MNSTSGKRDHCPSARWSAMIPAGRVGSTTRPQISSGNHGKSSTTQHYLKRLQGGRS